MREFEVFCGGLRPPKKVRDCLELDTDGSATAKRINLDLGQITRRMVEDIPPRYADVLQIAAYIYCADQFSRRDTLQMPDWGAHWRRRFHFRIPVRDTAFWKQTEVNRALVAAASFLSDDEYHFHFSAAPELPGIQHYLDLETEGPAHGFRPERIALFSGGLDSFAGAADCLLAGEQIALVSHRSSPMVSGKQAALIDALRQRTRPGQLFHISVGVNKGSTEAVEFTQRSRSFLFAALGAVVARLFRRSEVVFFENGIVSLNLPFAEHVLGARATRTTHPRVLSKFAGLFSLLAEQEVSFSNPFFWMTKADVVRKIVALGLDEQVPATFSCTRTREATQTGQHCGVCSQCVDRRFGIIAAGAKHLEPDDQYSVELFTGARQPGIDVTLVESFVLTASKFVAMTPAAFFSHYGQAFRALPYLPGSADENGTRIHEVHKRHGQEVTGVLNAELARHSGLDAELALPDTCLLAMVRTRIFNDPWLDRTEVEASPLQQQSSDAGLASGAPVRIAVDDQRREIVVAGGAVLNGNSFKLIHELYKQHRDAQQQNLAPDAYPCLKADQLAKRLGIEEPALRQLIIRTRKHIRGKTGGGSSQVVENVRWHGYRLDPYIVIQPRAVIEALGVGAQDECHDSNREVSQLEEAL